MGCATGGVVQEPYRINNLLDFRDRYFIVEFDRLDSSNSEARNETLQSWLEQLVNHSISVAFHFLKEQKMDETLSKLFAAQNIIRNFANLASKEEIQTSDIEHLNFIFAKQVLPSIKKKYPMASNSQITKNLMNWFQEIDNFQSSDNDYLLKSSIIMDFRTKKKYEDLIMEFLNQLIQLPDLKVNKIHYPQKTQETQKESQNQEADTIYNLFQEFMRNLFQSVLDYDIMNQKISSNKNIENLRNKYKEEVQSYTSYKIGRKISTNTQKFNSQAIRSQDITVKSPAILRILTKWAEELWKKFESQTYFLNMVQNPFLIDKKPSYSLSRKKKLELQQMVSAEKKVIEKQFEKIIQQNYQLQTQILNQSRNKKIGYVSDLQLREVFFSGTTLRSLEVFLSKYLNRLVHGLMDVSNQFSKHYAIKPICLFTTFKIGDLIRCKCKSKQKQIVYIYNCIKKVSSQKPELLKIIRLKNRIKEGTRDILINVRFYDKITAQIQLAIRSHDDKHTENYIKFNHFLYELQRARFGPISELCSILYNLNDKASTIEEAICESNLKVKTTNNRSWNKSYCSFRSHKFKTYLQPFLCSSCFNLKTSNQNVIANQKCERCEYVQCSDCRIKALTDEELKQIVFSDKAIIMSSQRYHPSEEMQNLQLNKIINQLPSVGGIALYKYSKRRIITAFKKMMIQKKQILITKRQFQNPLAHRKDQYFLKDYLVWINPSVSSKYFNEVSEKQIKLKCILPGTFNKYCKREKYKIQIQEGDMTIDDFQQLTGKWWTSGYRSNITNINLQKNCLTSMKRIFFIAPNIKELILDQNPIQEIDIPDNANSLQRLSLKRLYTNVKVNPGIKNTTKLKYISIGWNQTMDTPEQIKQKCLKFQIPKQLSVFQNLQELHIQWNGLENLSNQIFDIKSLKILTLSSNKFKKIPEGIWNLSKIQKFEIKFNQINQIPQKIKQLKSLTSLLLDHNMIAELPEEIGELKMLEQLSISQNQLKQIPKSLQKLLLLKRLNLSDNLLGQIPHQIFNLPKLEELLLNRNEISRIPLEIDKLGSNLRQLQLEGNLISQIPERFWSLKKLQSLNLNGNSLISFDQNIRKMPSLRVFQFQNNKFTQIDRSIIQLASLEQMCMKGNILVGIPQEMKHLKKLIYLNITPNYLNQESNRIYQSLKGFSWLQIIQQNHQTPNSP